MTEDSGVGLALRRERRVSRLEARSLLPPEIGAPAHHATSTLSRSPREHADLLHALGAIAVRHANTLRGLALIYAAYRLSPDDDIAKSLAHAYLVNGEPELALRTLDGLGGQSDGACSYLRAKALLAMGRLHEAQEVFARDVTSWTRGDR